MVLLRGYDERGFVFFTNYESAKARDLKRTGRAALLFYWAALERQVRIEGTIAVLDPAESGVSRRANAQLRRAFQGPGSRTAAALGRLSRRPRAVRVLARASRSRPRPDRVSPSRRGVVDRPAGTVRTAGEASSPGLAHPAVQKALPSMPGRSVMVIGSGPIVIGQAAEFDYAGVQACRALREEGHRVVLVNSNPATIMTDPEIADAVYLEPLTVASVGAIIARERPDALLPTLGGQTGLNLAVELSDAGILEKYGVELLGTPVETIRLAEDRERFKAKMIEIGEPVPHSTVVTDVEAGVAFAREVGYPLVVRPAYTLGGTGGGLVRDEDELRATLTSGLSASLIRQALLETSLLGWKEIEYEVLRDGANNCIIVCNMENIDPVGVHTGDSIVVAPSQTLSDLEYQMLRTASINVIRALKVQGGCNIQFALHPERSE